MSFTGPNFYPSKVICTHVRMRCLASSFRSCVLVPRERSADYEKRRTKYVHQASPQPFNLRWKGIKTTVPVNHVHIRSSLSMRLTSASPHDVCQTEQNDLPSFPSLIGRRRRWRFPATIIKMNHSTRDSGGSVGGGSGEEQGDRGGEGSVGYLSETMRCSSLGCTFIVCSPLRIMQVSLSPMYTTKEDKKPN